MIALINYNYIKIYFIILLSKFINLPIVIFEIMINGNTFTYAKCILNVILEDSIKYFF